MYNMLQYSTIAVTCIKHDTVFRANEAQSIKQVKAYLTDEAASW